MIENSQRAMAAEAEAAREARAKAIQVFFPHFLISSILIPRLHNNYFLIPRLNNDYFLIPRLHNNYFLIPRLHNRICTFNPRFAHTLCVDKAFNRRNAQIEEQKKAN